MGERQTFREPSADNSYSFRRYFVEEGLVVKDLAQKGRAELAIALPAIRGWRFERAKAITEIGNFTDANLPQTQGPNPPVTWLAFGEQVTPWRENPLICKSFGGELTHDKACRNQIYSVPEWAAPSSRGHMASSSCPRDGLPAAFGVRPASPAGSAQAG
jgi:hypothetical protein